MANITISDDVQSLEVSQKAKPSSTRGTRKVANLMSRQTKHEKASGHKIDQLIPDVIVN